MILTRSPINRVMKSLTTSIPKMFELDSFSGFQGYNLPSLGIMWQHIDQKLSRHFSKIGVYSLYMSMPTTR